MKIIKLSVFTDRQLLERIYKTVIALGIVFALGAFYMTVLLLNNMH